MVPVSCTRSVTILCLGTCALLASRLENRGVCVVASFLSPYRESRDFVRDLCQNFIEVHVATPLEVCESRDRKGLYAKARKGVIPEFTGISDPYEVPERAELRIDTANCTPMEAALQPASESPSGAPETIINNARKGPRKSPTV